MIFYCHPSGWSFVVCNCLLFQLFVRLSGYLDIGLSIRLFLLGFCCWWHIQQQQLQYDRATIPIEMTVAIAI